MAADKRHGWKPARMRLARIGFVGTVALLVVLFPMAAASTSFTKRIVAPFTGSHYNWTFVSRTGSAGGSVRNASFFNMSSGTGGFSVSAWADTNHMTHHRSGNNTSGSMGGGYVGVNLQFPFNNQSGTRVLTNVTVHLTFSLRGHVTMVPGSCPFVNSTRENNTCWESAYAQVTTDSGSLSVVNGKWLTSSSCSIWNGTTYLINQCPSLNEATDAVWTNTSTGIYGWGAGPNGTSTFNTGLWNFTMVFPLTKPLHKSETLDVGFDIYGYIGSSFIDDPFGAGGIPGAHASASLALTLHIASIVES